MIFLSPIFIKELQLLLINEPKGHIALAWSGFPKGLDRCNYLSLGCKVPMETHIYM